MTRSVAAPRREWLDAASIDPEVAARYPDYVAYLVVADDLESGPSDAASERALADAERTARERLDGAAPDTLPQIRQWHDAFRLFGAKPNRTRCSVEALLRRLDQGLPRVNRLTDAYNAVSIGHLVPIGGEDVDHYAGPLRLTLATGAEDFDTVAHGERVVEHPEPGEVVWRDDQGVTCRRWNWRQCYRTRITDHTTHAVFILDGLPALGPTGLEDAGARLTELLLELNPAAAVTTRVLRAS
ncbi:B3/B4 domain-containing protein [Pseudonocardia acaciae]|uniref:B3/B4 domain-containing protein n=1 Tax=Pseudonocardia acaciae TaxID=551276 RepID=UPI00048B3D36|nr:phenylalanine--tRNA ligase beta subunit-related protein [Pseudonocardia acaciae]